MTEFETKDSGERQQWASGMKRDVQTGKPRFALMWTKRQPYHEQMVTRYAKLLARGAEKYEDRNWEEGCGQEELDYAMESLGRHTAQLICGETDEDHAAAVWFNTQLIEYIRWRMDTPDDDDDWRPDPRLETRIRNEAAKRAHGMRRSERLEAAAKEFNAKLTAEAESLSIHLNCPPPPPEALGRPWLTPMSHFTMHQDGSVTDNRNGRTVVAGVSAHEDESWAERVRNLPVAQHPDENTTQEREVDLPPFMD